MDSQKKRDEILAFIWCVLALLVLTCLLSYTPDDIAFETSYPNSPVKNWVGKAGAFSAWFFFLCFGKASFFIPLLLIFRAVRRWSGYSAQGGWLRLFSLSVLFLSSSSLLSLLFHQSLSDQYRAGGLTGLFSTQFLTPIFGKAGIFVACSLFVLSILMATEFLILPLFLEAMRKAWGVLRGSVTRSPVVNLPRGAPPVTRPVVKEPPMPVEVKIAPPPAVSGPLFRLKNERPVENVKKSSESDAGLLISTPSGDYRLPPIDLLKLPDAPKDKQLEDSLRANSKILEETLSDFFIDAKVVEVEQGPTVTRYELQPASGVKIQRIVGLADDIALVMKVAAVRIIAPIPGKSRVGIEVPNAFTTLVTVREVIDSDPFRNRKSKLSLALGKDTSGEPIVADLSDMPHLLIAGTTGSGKTVCVNSIIVSLLYNGTPDEIKFLMIDPKMVELASYNGLPHLISPVVTDSGKVSAALSWVVGEMERRYRLFAKVGVRNIRLLNEKIQKGELQSSDISETQGTGTAHGVMPYIVVFIDELADLMMVAAREIEDAITRLAQLSRAVGIHMVLATQRPSVDVITGVIKANFPSRISFQVASKVDSRTVLDANGAEKLLGKGDMLLMKPGNSRLVRAQGALVADDEIERLVSYIKKQRQSAYSEDLVTFQEKRASRSLEFKRDEVYEHACQIILETRQASVSMLQRRLGLGYARAARLIDMMEEDGIVGPFRGSKPREILVESKNQQEKQDSSDAANRSNT